MRASVLRKRRESPRLPSRRVTNAFRVTGFRVTNGFRMAGFRVTNGYRRTASA